MLNAVYSTRFKKDYKLLKKRGLNMSELVAIMELLENEVPLDAKYNKHQLSGQYKGCSECHVETDWLLIYRIIEQQQRIYFIRTGSHSDLF